MEPEIKKVEIDIDLEKFRWSLVGDGYLREEAANMSHDELIKVLKDRITTYIDVEYQNTLRFGLLDDEEDE